MRKKHWTPSVQAADPALDIRHDRFLAKAPESLRKRACSGFQSRTSIVTDDQALWSTGAYGNRESIMPNMDRLAREEVKFNNAFVATPVCSPSRVAFLTGLHGSQVGITDYLSPDEATSGMGLPPSALTWPRVLQQNGYRTALSGKYHLGTQPEFHPTKRGFDYFMGTQEGFFAPMNPRLEVNGHMTELKGASSDIVMEDAMRWIQANHDKPFAALIHFREPHLPYTPVSEEDARLFKNLDPTIPDVKGLDREQVKRFYREYYAAVHAVDRNLGKLHALHKPIPDLVRRHEEII